MMKEEDNDVQAVTLQDQAPPRELLTCLVILISRVLAVWGRLESVATYNAKVQQQMNSDKPTCLLQCYSNNIEYMSSCIRYEEWGASVCGIPTQDSTRWTCRNTPCMKSVYSVGTFQTRHISTDLLLIEKPTRENYSLNVGSIPCCR